MGFEPLSSRVIGSSSKNISKNLSQLTEILCFSCEGFKNKYLSEKGCQLCVSGANLGGGGGRGCPGDGARNYYNISIRSLV